MNNVLSPSYFGWITVESSEPEIGEDVLVALEGETILKGCRKLNGWTAYYMDGQQLTGTRKVTHWMPLPPIPGESPTLSPPLLRTSIAAMCLQGLLSNPNYNNPDLKHNMVTVPDTALAALKYADALLSHLEKIKS